MAYDNDLRGVLFKNKDKKGETHADYQGNVTVDGQEYWLNAWIKRDKNGNPYMSLALKAKQSQGIPPHPASQKAQPKPPARDPFDSDSDCPF